MAAVQRGAIMGCGSSSPANVVDGEGPNGKLGKRDQEGRGIRPPPTGADDDDIPTEVLPESAPAPVKPRRMTLQIFYPTNVSYLSEFCVKCFEKYHTSYIDVHFSAFKVTFFIQSK